MSSKRIACHFLAEAIPPFVIFVAFIATHLPYYNTYGSLDEGLFVPQAGLVDQGFQPYRDFEFGHPPAWLWTVVGLWRILGISDPWTRYYAAKMLSIVCLTGTATFTYLAARRLHGSKTKV